MKNPKFIRVLCIVLVIALIAPIYSLSDELIHTTDDISFISLLLVLVFSFLNYLFTVRFCNRLLNLSSKGIHKGKYISYLLMCIVVFIFALFGFCIFCYDLIIHSNDYNQSLFPGTKSGLVDILTYTGLIIYAVLGSFMFFMQLNIRKQLIKSEDTIELLINSIGSEMEMKK